MTKENDEGNKSRIREWIQHGEWASIIATVLACFLFVHHENVHLTERLDSHIQQINRRVDESNAQLNNRCDQLHKEFYELLKEIRKSENA